MAPVLLTTLGSYGDLYPYLALGASLKRLGHTVTVATSAAFRQKVESQALEFVPVRPDVSLDNREMMEIPFPPAPRDRARAARNRERYRETYEDTLPAVEKADVVVTHPITFAAVVAVQKLRKPWVSSVLAPISFVSAYDPPVPAPFPPLVRLRALGPGVMRAVWNLGKKASLPWVKPVFELRRELGIPTTLHPLFEGANSPDLVIAMFSRHFAAPQPDWPPQTVTTGFPFYNSGDSTLAPELEEFFNRGPAPIVFTLGSSAVSAAGRFYADSLQASVHLNARAVFLIGSHTQGLPDTLPDTAIRGHTRRITPCSLAPRRSSIRVE